MGFRYATGRLYKPRAVSAGDWWLSGGINSANCIIAYQPKGAASYAASLVNLANPGTYDATEGNAPTFASGTGWTFNGSNDYLKTGISPAINRTWSVIIRFSGYSSSGAKAIFGNYNQTGDNNNAFHCYPNNSSSLYCRSGSLPPQSKAPGMTSGVMAIAGTKMFRDGVDQGTTFIADGTGNASELYIAALNYNYGTPVQYIGATVEAMAIYDIDISSYVSALTTAMNAL